MTTEITAFDVPRVFVPRSGNAFYISRVDVLLVMCKRCGGCMSITAHVPVGETRTPIVKQCRCEGGLSPTP